MTKNGVTKNAPYFARRKSPQAEFSTTTLVLGVAGFLVFMSLLFWVVETFGLAELQLMVAGAGLWGPLIYSSA